MNAQKNTAQNSDRSDPETSHHSAQARVSYKVDIIVIGAGQAGLSSAYYLKRRGMKPGKGFVVLDDAPGPGGAWQHRWSSLTLKNVNGVSDLPGMHFSDACDLANKDTPVNTLVPEYYGQYEEKFDLPVFRPVRVNEVSDRSDRFIIRTDGPQFSSLGIINATGTWQAPNLPKYPGSDKFKGRQLHTKDYRKAEDFAGKHVIIVGAGISAINLLDEISRVTSTTWVTRRPPDFREGEFTDERGREAVAKVEKRVRRGLPPESVVSITGLPVTPEVKAMKERGVLDRKPMFNKITEEGVRWADGTSLEADVILWCTGFRHSLDHLEPLKLRNVLGGITMTGRLATQVEKDPRVHLVGYGPSASTIGANRAGRAAATELMKYLGVDEHDNQ
jgi:cation diffusion facilitator CzcD-associated flavoprotein CzcO